MDSRSSDRSDEPRLLRRQSVDPAGHAVGQHRPHLHRSAVQYGPGRRRAPSYGRGATRRATALGFRAGANRTERLGTRAFDDAFEDYLGFLEPRLEEAHRLLAVTGSLYLHLDYREVHYAKVLLDGIFGRDSFLNEIIWAYDYGGRTKKKWPPKHDNILVYAKDPERYYFDTDEVERIPLHGARAGRSGKGRPGQAAHGHLVAHDRAHERQGAHRLPDAEAGGHRAPDHSGLMPARRHGAGLLRRQRHGGRDGARAGPALRTDRRQPRGAGGHGAALRGTRGRGVRSDSTTRLIATRRERRRLRAEGAAIGRKVCPGPWRWPRARTVARAAGASPHLARLGVADSVPHGRVPKCPSPRRSAWTSPAITWTSRCIRPRTPGASPTRPRATPRWSAARGRSSPRGSCWRRAAATSGRSMRP